MVTVKWTDNAIQDLDDIAEYIAKDSLRYAQLTVTSLFTSVDILEKFPRIGKMNDAIQNDKIRDLIRGNYRIVYRIVDDNLIDILTVHNSARLIDNAFDFSEIE